MRIDRSSLGQLSKLGEGGSGDVYDILGTGTVYKEFNQLALVTTDIRLWAEGSVAFRDSLSAADRAELDVMAVWPTATVHDAGTVVGVVMPLLPDHVFHTRVAKNGSTERQLNEIKWLLVPPRKLQGRFDVDVLTDELVRYDLLGQAFGCLAWLHARGVCFGDVSHGNFVFALNPPRVVAIDTDAVGTGLGTDAAFGRQTPHYFPPEMLAVPAHDRIDDKTDVWKAAILALRALTPGDRAFQRRADDIAMLVGHAPPRIVDVLTRALGEDRDLRPSMDELAMAFLAHVASLSSPPVAVQLDVIDRLVRRGTPVTVAWELDGADSLALDTPDGVRHQLDPVRDAHGVTVWCDVSGLLAVHATNRHGTSTFPLGPIHVYDLPTVPVLAGLTPPPAPPDPSLLVAAAPSSYPSAPSAPVWPLVGFPVRGVTPPFLEEPHHLLPGLDVQQVGVVGRLGALSRSGEQISSRLSRLLGG